MRWVQASPQPCALSRNAGRAVTRVTLLRLNAADGEHGFARDVDGITAEGEGQHGVLGKAELARTNKENAVLQVALGKHPVDARHPDLERERDVVREDQRRRTRSSFATVDRDEVDTPLAGFHRRRELVPELHLAHRGLDTDRKARFRCNGLREVEHRIDVAKGRVPRWTQAVLTYRNTANLRDRLRHLLAGQHASHAGLRALAELDLDRAHGRCSACTTSFDERSRSTERSRASLRAAEVAGADLPDQVAAVVVVRRRCRPRRCCAGSSAIADSRGSALRWLGLHQASRSSSPRCSPPSSGRNACFARPRAAADHLRAPGVAVFGSMARLIF